MSDKPGSRIFWILLTIQFALYLLTSLLLLAATWYWLIVLSFLVFVFNAAALYGLGRLPDNLRWLQFVWFGFGILMIVLFSIGLLVAASGTEATPYIYTFF
ncbi:MAG: hypothetical protein VX738_12200 [Planctomycetota bacterium]|nr:hypothetical protein [Planctomycetota bacterium]